MKKNLFWKIMAVLFFIWLCLFLWSSSIDTYYRFAESPTGGVSFYKINKISGSVKVNIIYSDLTKKSGWYSPEKEESKEINEENSND